MKLSRAKVFTSLFICVLILVFSYQFLVFAQQPEPNTSAALDDLLTGKSSDFNAAASLITEKDLPAALSAIDLLKFKALHQEIPADIDQVNNFENLIKSRLEKSTVVSFSKNETCRQKVEQTELEIAGRKLLVPEYFIADQNLTVTGVLPSNEAGTIFPDLQINLFSQTPLTDYSLIIDKKEVPAGKIKLFKDQNELGLIFQPEITSENILSIGTHTAVITITNEAGEQIKKEWSFTVGVYDTSTPPLPEGTKIIKELPISPEKILPGHEISGTLSVIVYQDKTGRRYTEYKLVTPSGTTFKTRNLAYIARKVSSTKDFNDKLTVLPKLSYAFIDNQIGFSYDWSGEGKILKTEWTIRSGSNNYTEPDIKFSGYTEAKCELTIEYSFVNNDGIEQTFQTQVLAYRFVRELTISARINSDRAFHISNQAPFNFALSGSVDSWVVPDLVEGAEYPVINDDESSASLKVDRLRWKLLSSEGDPQIVNPLATQTNLIFAKPGFAEVAFDVALSWTESGLTLHSSYKPETSGLYAFYPVEGKVEFKKLYPGQLVATRRRLDIKKFEFKIKDQERQINYESDWQLNQPITLCQSTLSAASSPLQITNALPLIRTGHFPSGSFLEKKGILNFLTPMPSDPGEIGISLYCQFQKVSNPNAFIIDAEKASLISDLPALQVFSGHEVLALNLKPAEELTIQEGQQVEFSTEVVPAENFGTGILSKAEKTLDILDGYKIKQINGINDIFWYEQPMWEEEGDDWKTRASKSIDFSHFFDPVKGVGSYTMMCAVSFDLEESETKDTAWVIPFNGVPVTVTPGLRILAPIDKLAYPLNQTIKVKTTLDSEEFQDQWEKITWKLNGKDFVPEVKKPGFPLELTKTGKWKLEAELKTEDPNTGEEIVLKDAANFEVIALDITLLPSKSVIDYNKQKFEKLKLSVVANGNEAEKPGVPFTWQADGAQAIVDPIEWFQVASPSNSLSATLDPDEFSADCNISQPGAATFLATVTVRLIDAEKLFKRKHKGFKDRYEEPVFTFPVIRADLWAVKVGEMKRVDKHFPDRSIAKAYRTYEVASFAFDCSSNPEEFSFNQKNGLNRPISLDPALYGIDSISASLNFKWAVSPSATIEQEIVKPARLIINPAKPQKYQISVQADLDFGNLATIKLGEISASGTAVDLFDLIETRVDPASFTITVGETQSLKYVVNSLEQQPSGGNGQPDSSDSSGSVNAFDDSSDNKIIYLLDKSYAVTIKNVEWSYSQGSSPSPTPAKNSIESNPYELSSNEPGKIEGLAKGHLKVQELKSEKTEDFDASANFSGNVFPKSIQILINGKPLGSESYHMGQKVVLSYKIEPDDLENIVWSVENPLAYKSEMNTREEAATHTVKNYQVEALKDKDLKQKQIEFYLYDFEPDKVVKNGSFTYQISGDEFVKEFKISYERPVFTRPTFIHPLGQDVDKGWDNVQKKWRFGFSDKNRLGVYAEGQLVNNTEVNYIFGSYQLISVDAARTFIKFKDNIATNPPVIQQFLQTIGKTDSFGTSPKIWLDTTAPQDDKAQRAIVFSRDNSIIEIANDRPSITLDETMERGGSLYYAGGSFVKEEFLVYVFAKPTDLTDIHSEDPDYYQSIWFPVAVFAWSWKGQVTYDINNDSWSVTGTDTANLSEKSIASFSSWPDVAIGDSNPKWRDL